MKHFAFLSKAWCVQIGTVWKLTLFHNLQHLIHDIHHKVFTKNVFRRNTCILEVNPIRSRGGGNIAPPDFWQALQSPKSFWLFLNMYILWLHRKKRNVNPYRLAERGVKSAGQDILCIFWTYLHFYDVLFRFYHVRCLNMLELSHRFNFWDRNFFGAFWPTCYFCAKFWPYLTGHFISCAILRRSAHEWFQMFEWGLKTKHDKSYFV